MWRERIRCLHVKFTHLLGMYGIANDWSPVGPLSFKSGLCSKNLLRLCPSCALLGLGSFKNDKVPSHDVGLVLLGVRKPSRAFLAACLACGGKPVNQEQVVQMDRPLQAIGNVEPPSIVSCPIDPPARWAMLTTWFACWKRRAGRMTIASRTRGRA